VFTRGGKDGDLLRAVGGREVLSRRPLTPPDAHPTVLHD
jgi:hypothetical protein